MSKDIAVDEQELAEFIQVLSAFQDVTIDKFKAVEAAWTKCDRSWEGESKDEFTKEFEETKDRVQRALKAGLDALKWLEDFDEIVKEFEQNY